MSDERRITVCDKCLTAACWAYVFPCEFAISAGTTTRTVAELRKLDLEHESYWALDEVQACE